uniref:TspO/MBR-related protein n=1 Tax=Homalodisca liturata TaxID=320908 RepID=A0A1B6HPS3_9HEMI
MNESSILLDVYFPECLPKVEYLDEVHQAEEAAKELIESSRLSNTNWQVVGAILLPLLGGNYIRHAGGSRDYIWVQSSKPSKSKTGDIAFPIAWSSLYAQMGYASYLVWRNGSGFTGARLPLAMYSLQLALNFSAPFSFFSKHNSKSAFINILLLDTAAVGTAVLFYHKTPLAGFLMAPYLVWLSLATVFNYKQWKDIHERN